MEDARLNILERKSLLALNAGFSVNAGELGQMEADVFIDGIKIISQEMQDDARLFQIRIIEIVNVFGGKRKPILEVPSLGSGKVDEVKLPKNVFTLPDDRFPNIDERDIGKKIRVIINFKVVEKMSRYTLLRINSVFPVPQQDISMRMYV